MEGTILQENVCGESKLPSEGNSQVEKVLFPAHQEGDGTLLDVSSDDAGVGGSSGEGR